jgi:hypothetical protein
MSRRLLCLAAFLLAVPLLDVTWSAQPPISKEEIASILRYPAERLLVEDITIKVRQKSGEAVVSAHRYTAEGNTFAPMTIVVGTEGSLLTQKLQRETDEYLAKAAAEPQAKPAIRRIKVGDGGEGIAGLGGVGPGGSQERLVVTLPAQKRDVQMTVTIPGEALIEQVPGAEEYHHALTTDGLAKSLVQCIDAIVSKGPTASADVSSAPALTTTPSVPTIAVARQTPMPSSLAAASAVVQTPTAAVEQRAPLWPWVMAILVLAAGAAFAWKRGA